MLATFLCLIFPVLLLYAAWSDLATMEIPNWVSISLAVGFVPAAAATGLSMGEIGVHLAFAAVVLMVCAGLFYLNVFGGGDAKVIAAASLWTGLAASGQFVLGMALAGGVLAFVLIVLRRLKVSSDQAWAARLLSPDEGAPYAVAIAAGAFLAAPSSPILASGLGSLMV